MPPPPQPLEIRRDATARRVSIEWSDGHHSEYPFAYLRGWCPCAACQGHSGEKRYVHGGDDTLEKIAAVGRYAFSFVWGDGHETGIYSYPYLRQLCPCCS
ncbi:MAG: DUF971 domain-containing protein [bacterium]